MLKRGNYLVFSFFLIIFASELVNNKFNNLKTIQL